MTTVQEAEANLQAAILAVEQANKQSLLDQLAAAIETGHVVKAEYVRLEREFRVAESSFNLLRGDLNVVNHAIDEHHAEAPSVTDFPSAQLLRDRAVRLNELQAEHARVREKLLAADAILSPLRLETIQAHANLERAQKAVLNLQSRIEANNG